MSKHVFQYKQPPTKHGRCVECQAEVESNEIAPLCDSCQSAAEAYAKKREVEIEEKKLQNELTISQIEVLKSACVAHGQAVKICDALLEKFGGAEGFAAAWYADALQIITDPKKSGTALSQRFFSKFAEYQLAVSKVSGQDLGAIDKMDEEDVVAELQVYEARLIDGQREAS